MSDWKGAWQNIGIQSGISLNDSYSTPVSGVVDPFEIFKNLDPSSQIHQGLLGKLGGAARNLASLLEPLQLPQDLLFAAIAGLSDPNSNFTDRFTHDEGFWKSLYNYLPGGPAPQRPSSGAEILKLFGVDNKKVQKYAGFALDLTADPLLIGGWVKGLGTAAKALGAEREVANSLIKLGESFDRATSPLAVYRTLPQGLRQSVEKTASNFGRSLFLNRVPWNSTEAASTVGDVLLARRTALKQQFPKTAFSFGADLNAKGIRDVSVGEEIAAIHSRASTAGRDVQERAVTLLGEANAALSGPFAAVEDQRNWVQKFIDVVGRKQQANAEIDQMPQILKTFIDKNGWRFIDNHGAYLIAKGESDVPEIKNIISIVGPDRLKAAAAKSADDIEVLLGDIAKVAEQVGYPADIARSRAMKFIQKAAESDSLAGYYESGMDYVQKKVMTRVIEVTGDEAIAGRVMGDLFAAGMSDNYDAFMKSSSGISPSDVVTYTEEGAKRVAARREAYNTTLRSQAEARVPAAQARAEAARVRDVIPAPQAELRPGVQGLINQRNQKFKNLETPGPGEPGYIYGPPRSPGEDAFKNTAAGRAGFKANTDPFTMRELLGNDFEQFVGLPVSEYLSGFVQGHVRRAYAMLQDTPSFKKYINGVENGQVFLNNVVNETFGDIPQAFKAETDIVKQFFNTIAEKNQSAVVSQQSVFQHLLDNGVGAKRAHQFIGELIKAENPHLTDTISRIQDWADRFSHLSSSPTKRYGVYGRQAFVERSALTSEDLQALGEFSDTTISAFEQANLARTRVPFTKFMQDTYELANEHGYVTDVANYVDPVSNMRYTQIPIDDVQTWGGYAGKWIHPYLKKEILQAMQNRGSRAPWLNRIRSLITAGYLASPNVLVANIAGGFYQTAAAGIAPADMARSMIRTLGPILKHDQGKEKYWVLDRLAQAFDVNESSLVGQNLMKEFDRLKFNEAGLNQGGVRQFFDQMATWAEDQLRSPGVGKARVRWLGLDGFQFSERWMKVAAFDARYNYLKNVEGLSDNLAQRAAAESARISVFDYSEIPQAFKTLRNSGLLLFPGFTYFLVPRTVRGLAERPGVIAAANRMSDAINSAQLDPEEKLALYASMPDWLKQEHGTVVHKYVGEDGVTRYSAIPLNQMVPTSTMAGNPWGESLATLGIYRPFLEILNAYLRGDGAAIFSGRYGQTVFDQGAKPGRKAVQTAEFLMSNLAPGSIRKLGVDPKSLDAALVDPSQGPRGIIPKFVQTVFNLPKTVGETAYSVSELQRSKPDRQLRDEVLAATFRSPTVLTTSGPLSSFSKVYNSAKMQLDAEVGVLKDKMLSAQLSGNQRAFDSFQAKIQARLIEFQNTWEPAIQAVQQAQQPIR